MMTALGGWLGAAHGIAGYELAAALAFATSEVSSG
jgi:hypothetical protein